MDSDAIDEYCDEVPTDTNPCYVHWLDYTIGSYEYYLIKLGFPECVTFAENLSGLKETVNPCIAYNDSDRKQNCALCAINSIRIMVILNDGNKYVVCGSVRSSGRNEDGVYTFLDPDTVTQD